MLLDAVPIERFLAERLRLPSIQKIIEEWEADPIEVVGKLSQFFRDMGIYRVSASNEKVIAAAMVVQLRKSDAQYRQAAAIRRERAKQGRRLDD